MASTSQNKPYEYFAFISYKREDEKWAKWLQKKLESYSLPTAIRKDNPELPNKIRPVFRDQSELSGGNLKTEIEKGLNGSKYLIVICSPRSAQSPWVSKEVQHFIDQGRQDYIIPFIIGGTPNATYPEDECFPEGLRQLTGEKEILGININEMGCDAAAIKVIARMFDLRFDTLWQRFKRSEKLKHWVYFSIGLIFTCLLSSLLILSNQFDSRIKFQNSISYARIASILEGDGNYSKVFDTIQSAISNDYLDSPEMEHQLYHFAILPFFSREQILQLNGEIVYILDIKHSNKNVYLSASGGLTYVLSNGKWITKEDEFSQKASLKAVNSDDHLFIYTENKSGNCILFDSVRNTKYNLGHILSAEFINKDTAIVIRDNREMCMIDSKGSVLKKWLLPYEYNISNGNPRLLCNDKKKEIYIYNSRNCFKWNYGNLVEDYQEVLKGLNHHIDSFDVDSENDDYIFVSNKTLYWGDKYGIVNSMKSNDNLGDIILAKFIDSGNRIFLATSKNFCILKNEKDSIYIVQSMRQNLVPSDIYVPSKNMRGSQDLIIAAGNAVCRVIPNKLASYHKVSKYNNLKPKDIVATNVTGPHVAIRRNDSIYVYDFLNSKNLSAIKSINKNSRIVFVNKDLYAIINENVVMIYSLGHNITPVKITAQSPIKDIATDPSDMNERIFISTDNVICNIDLKSPKVIQKQKADFMIRNVFPITYQSKYGFLTKEKKLFVLSSEDSLYIYPHLHRSILHFEPSIKFIKGSNPGLPFILKQIPILANKMQIIYPSFEKKGGIAFYSSEMNDMKAQIKIVNGEQLSILMPELNKIKLFNSISSDGKFYINELDYVTYRDIHIPKGISAVEILYRNENNLFILATDGIYSIEIPTLDSIKEYILSIK